MPRPASSSASPRTLTPVPSASSTSASVAICARAGVHRPVATRRSRSAAVSTPRPSSEISSTSRLPSWRARIVIVAVGGLPRDARSSGGSMPWATALRSSCVIGSTSCSATALSNSVSSPSVRSSTLWPVARRSARSVRAAWVMRFLALSMRMRTRPRCSSPIVRRSASISSSSAAVVCESRAAWLASSLSAAPRLAFAVGCSRSIASRRLWRVRARSRASVRRSWTRRSMRVRSNSSSPALDISASIRSGSTRRYDFGSGTATASDGASRIGSGGSMIADVGIDSESAAEGAMISLYDGRSAGGAGRDPGDLRAQPVGGVARRPPGRSPARRGTRAARR